METPRSDAPPVRLRALAARGVRVRLRLEGDCTPEERAAVLRHLLTLSTLPEPGDHVRLPGIHGPGTGSVGTVEEVYATDARGFRVAVRPDGAAPYETRVLSPSDLRPVSSR